MNETSDENPLLVTVKVILLLLCKLRVAFGCGCVLDVCEAGPSTSF
jgi:hypothetical protein